MSQNMFNAAARPAAGVARPNPDAEDEEERIITTDFSKIGQLAIAEMTESDGLYPADFQLRFVRAAIHNFAVRMCNKSAGLPIYPGHLEPQFNEEGFLDGPFIECVVDFIHLGGFLEDAGYAKWACLVEKERRGRHRVCVQIADADEREEILSFGHIRLAGVNHACSLLRAELTPPHSPTNTKQRVLLSGLTERLTESILMKIVGLAGELHNNGGKPRLNKVSGTATVTYRYPVHAQNAITLLNGFVLFDLVICARLF